MKILACYVVCNEEKQIAESLRSVKAMAMIRNGAPSKELKSTA
jgi:hypothetical protein